MRYPEGSNSNRRSHSITISGESGSDHVLRGNSSSGHLPRTHQHPLRFPSSSSQESQSSLILPAGGGGEDDSVTLPGQAPPLPSRDGQVSTTGGRRGDPRQNIETISEHVLFGNNNGQNSFLYLYYSSSSNGNGTNSRINTQIATGANSKSSLLRRPYTTGGGGGAFNPAKGEPKFTMGSERDGAQNNNNELWKGTKREENEEEEEKAVVEEKVEKSIAYPVYLSPVEGSPVRSGKSPDLGEGEEEEDELEDSRTSSRITGGPRQDRLDSFGGDLLDDDWEKIYSVPDVDPDYLQSGRASGTRTTTLGTTTTTTNSSSTDTYQSHHYNRSEDKRKYQLDKQQSTTSSTSHLSVKRVRVTPGADGGQLKKWSSGSISQLTPSGPSRTPSTRSIMCQGSTPRHGVTSHHHKPLSGGSGPPGPGGRGSGRSAPGDKRVSSTATDGMDQMSFQFQNGIGAFFGTPASRQISHKTEPTPEEMYKEEMQGWRPRLATGSTIFMATLFILSCVSLLFVFPILVDPILVGFEAQFSSEPVTCRTTNFRNGTGPGECATPSCREGCTLDLFSCIFVDVEYTAPEPRPSITNSNTANSSFSRTSATLLINVNGCGYPPEVTCSDFERKYARVNTQFPCYFSKQNGSIVVPSYSRHTEIIHLTLAICIPFGLIAFSGISLVVLIRYHKYLKLSIYRKYSERKKEARRKRREERERNNNGEEMKDVEAGKRKSSEDENDDEEEDEEVDQEPQSGYNYRRMQNGASRTGKEATRLMLKSTEM